VTTRIHTKIAKTIAAAAVIAVIIVPATSASPSKGTPITIPSRLANFREPGSTGYVPKATRVVLPARFAHFREPGSTGWVPKTTRVVIPARFAHFNEPSSTGWVPTSAPVATTVRVGNGLDWVSALIGAGAALGVAAASAGGLMALRKRRTLAHA
jgi:hypothetical protein